MDLVLCEMMSDMNNLKNLHYLSCCENLVDPQFLPLPKFTMASSLKVQAVEPLRLSFTLSFTLITTAFPRFPQGHTRKLHKIRILSVYLAKP